MSKITIIQRADGFWTAKRGGQEFGALYRSEAEANAAHNPFDFAPGAVLPNGAVVIAARRIRDCWVVLALRPDFSDDPYVTWKANDLGTTVYGSYFDSIGEAASDFAVRA